MVSSKVAKRYAQGLLDFVQESQQTDVIAQDMQSVKRIMKENPDLKRFLSTPYVDAKKKLAAAKQIFSSLNPTSQNLIQMVIKHGRENQLEAICTAFIDKVDTIKGIQKVKLTVASELSQEAIDKIIASTSLIDLAKPKDLSIHVKPEIIGGYILRVGDQQIDASVKTKLTHIEKSFLS